MARLTANYLMLISIILMSSSLFSPLYSPIVEAGSFREKGIIKPSSTVQENIEFPRGVYWPTKPDQLDQALLKGFNYFNFAYDTEESLNDEKINVTAMLDRADELQTSVIFGLNYFIELAQWDNLTSLVNRLKKYQCIKIWELIDEPGSHNIPASQLVQAADVVRSLDPRPLFIQYSPHCLHEWEEYASLFDSLNFTSVDPYPSFPSQNYSYVTSELEFLSQLNQGRTPYFVVLKAYATEPGLLPRPVDLWFQTLLSLQANVSGVFYFWHGDYNITEFPLVGIWDNLALVSNMSWILAPLKHFQVDNNPVTNTSTIGPVKIYQKRIAEKKLAVVITDHSYEWNGDVYTWNPQSVRLSLQVPVEWNNFQIEVTEFAIESNTSSISDFPLDGNLTMDLSFESGMVIIIESKEPAIAEFQDQFTCTGILSAIVLIFYICHRVKRPLA